VEKPIAFNLESNALLHSKLSLMKSLVGTFAACALFNLAAAQTPAPASAPNSKPADSTAPPAGDKAAQPTVITAKVSEPTLATKGPSADTLKAAKAAGYQIRGSGDKTRFCKSEAEIGRRIPETTCFNEDQFTQMQLKNEQERERLKSAIGTSSH
jgi:hypothetical protein